VTGPACARVDAPERRGPWSGVCQRSCVGGKPLERHADR